MKAKLLSLAASCAAAGVMLAASAAQATVLMATLTVDNGYFAYISTSDSTLGTLVGSGTYWPNATTFSALLPNAPKLFLHIEAVNTGNIGGFLGDFSLTGTKFSFANGTQSLSTGTADWKGILNDANHKFIAQPWVTPTGAVATVGKAALSGKNAAGEPEWGFIAGIKPTSQWIWSADSLLPSGKACPACTVDFSTELTSVVPEPAEWAMIITGLGMIGATARFGRRRRALAL